MNGLCERDCYDASTSASAGRVRRYSAELEGKGVAFYSDVNVVDEGPLAGWRWVYFSDPDGLALELVEVAYYLKDEREANSAEYLRTRPSLPALEARIT